MKETRYIGARIQYDSGSIMFPHTCAFGVKGIPGLFRAILELLPPEALAVARDAMHEAAQKTTHKRVTP